MVYHKFALIFTFDVLKIDDDHLTIFLPQDVSELYRVTIAER
jgi:hypothetical protein